GLIVTHAAPFFRGDGYYIDQFAYFLEQNVVNTTCLLADIYCMKRIIIMRGCPGSGKSFLAHRIAGRTGAKLFSADTFLTNGCGEYVWTIELTHEAHAICEHLVEIAMRKGERTIVVDNTHLRPKAAKVYVNL